MALALLMRAAELVESNERLSTGDSVVPQFTSKRRSPPSHRMHPYQRPKQTYAFVPGYSPNAHYCTVPIHSIKKSSDEELTDDDCVPETTPQPRKPTTGRSSNPSSGSNSAHNEVEKRRRAYLTQCYTELHNILPNIAGSKASNATVLRTATDHIKVLELEAKNLNEALQAQRIRRQQLLARREELQGLSAGEVPVATPRAKPTSSMMSIDDAGSDNEMAPEVPDNLSRPVSPSFSPHEDLTQLASPIRKGEKVPAVVGRRTGRNRVRSILLAN